MLLVRKRGTSAFMRPGGKIDANRSALAALAREVFHSGSASCIAPGRSSHKCPGSTRRGSNTTNLGERT